MKDVRKNKFSNRRAPNARPGVAPYGAPQRSPSAQAAYGRERKKTMRESKTPLENTPHLASAGDAVYPLTAFVKDRFGHA
jgi:hypothetical protein